MHLFKLIIVNPLFEINYAADGKISRMSMMEGDLSDEEVELGIERDDGRGSGTLNSRSGSSLRAAALKVAISTVILL